MCVTPDSLGEIIDFQLSSASANSSRTTPAQRRCTEAHPLPRHFFAVFPESVQLIMKPLNSLCFQCSPALPGGAEEATTESDKEDQHLHRHLHALLRSLCDHKVSAGERPMQEGGERETTLTHCGIHSLFFFVLLVSPKTSLLCSQPPPLHFHLPSASSPHQPELEDEIG